MIKPIAFFDPHKGFYWAKPTKITAPVTVDVESLALYTERTWVGLTDEERKEIHGTTKSPYDDLIAIEQALKDKNT